HESSSYSEESRTHSNLEAARGKNQARGRDKGNLQPLSQPHDHRPTLPYPRGLEGQQSLPCFLRYDRRQDSPLARYIHTRVHIQYIQRALPQDYLPHTVRHGMNLWWPKPPPTPSHCTSLTLTLRGGTHMSKRKANRP